MKIEVHNKVILETINTIHERMNSITKEETLGLLYVAQAILIAADVITT